MSNDALDDSSQLDTGPGSGILKAGETISDTELTPEAYPTDPMIGDYMILERIGSGGMGHVFKARHRRMDRVVALKVLPPSSMRSSVAVERFQREVRAAAQLFHPNIVTAFDAGEQNGIHYLVMEFVDGKSLGALVKERGPLPVSEALDYILQVARGLQYAHSREVIHRDIKPSNLLLENTGIVKVLDMGMARFRGSVPDVSNAAPDGLTETGVIIGTVDFMSPEQARDARNVDHRSDIYSLGCTLHYLLTGKAVYSGDLVQTLLAHAANPIPLLHDARPDVPAQLDRVFKRMMAKVPDDRQSSIGELIEELEACGVAVAPEPSAPTDTSRLGKLVETLQDTVGEVAGVSSSTVSKIQAVGVNIGTSYCSIAYLDDDGQPVTVDLGEAAMRIPSVVMVDGSNIAVGQTALQTIGSKGHCLADRIKRHLTEPRYPRGLSGVDYAPEVLLGIVIKRLVDEARARIGHFEHVVISVPAFFDDVRRKAVQDASCIAGLNVLDIVNEPTATAISYCLEGGLTQSDTEETQTILVIDWGGGTLDATVFHQRGRNIQAVATDGDLLLGGCDWDDKLVDLAADQFQQEHGLDPRDDAIAAARLRFACEAAKCSLSTSSRATITFQYRGRSTRVRITRDQLEQLGTDFLRRLRAVIRRTLKSAHVGLDDLDEVLLSGGVARMPIVRRTVREVTRRHPDTSSLESDTVAHGAALVASDRLLKRESQPTRMLLTEISSHSLGVIGVDSQTGRRRNAILIPRNTPLPAVTKRSFRTKASDHESFQVRIIQGEDRDPDRCTRIGKCELGALPTDVPPGSPITVEFHYGADGRLTVYVETPGDGLRVTKEITRASGLAGEQIDRWRKWVETMLLCSNV